MIYALDTNIISCFLKSRGEVEKHFEKEIILSGHSYVIPPVVVFELKRWLHDNPTPNLLIFAKAFDALYKSVRERAEMNVDAWEKAADIYISLKQKGELIDDADILIASYCIVNDYVLVTNNLKHFKRIAGLRCVDWK